MENDRRYRMMVILARTDRPRNYKFHCFRCKMPVAEFINTSAYAVSDTVDMENKDTNLIGVRCDGRFEGSRCNFWYYFSLNQDKE